ATIFCHKTQELHQRCHVDICLELLNLPLANYLHQHETDRDAVGKATEQLAQSPMLQYVREIAAHHPRQAPRPDSNRRASATSWQSLSPVSLRCILLHQVQ